MIFLHFTVLIFFISLLGIFVVRNNLIIILVCIELMLISINFNFIYFSYILDDLLGQLFFLCILGVAGAEASIGLAILIVYYRIRGIISSEVLSFLKG